ncbi:MAG: polyphosphate kinase 2 family protein [Deltaproteobacteria bacterium]|nr:polyphosphate kinase 2 family protein [Deltaproteobacteria bacterium]
MVDFPASPYRVPYDGSFRVAKAPTLAETDGDDDDKEALRAAVSRISDLQGRLYAHNRLAVLLIFQAMDAAGKDSTIRAVLSGVELLAAQSLPGELEPERLWAERYESIRDHERHLARSGLVILKFWLNVSLEEQTRRLLRRIDDPKRNYKFESRDVTEQAHWADYMASYELALRQTSTPWAPWYAIPADDKPKMRRLVAEHIAETLESLHLPYPELPRRSRDELDELRRTLKARLKG